MEGISYLCIYPPATQEILITQAPTLLSIFNLLYFLFFSLKQNKITHTGAISLFCWFAQEGSIEKFGEEECKKQRKKELDVILGLSIDHPPSEQKIFIIVRLFFFFFISWLIHDGGPLCALPNISINHLSIFPKVPLTP